MIFNEIYFICLSKNKKYYVAKWIGEWVINTILYKPKYKIW